MRRITLLFFAILMTALSWHGMAQVVIGDQNGTTPTIPIQSSYGYSYTQQLIYQSEINASGDITSISFYLDGANNTSNSNDWTVYLGTTSKTEFITDSDWVPFANLSQVYSGTVTFPAANNQMVITFDADFTYDNTDNLVVAVHESQSGYDFGISFGKTASFEVDRSIYYRSDSTNPDPASPPADPGFSGGTLDYTNNVILGGIQQSCPAPSDLAVNDATTNSVNATWTENGSSSSWEVVYGVTGFDPLIDGTTVPASNDPEASLSGLTHSTSYDFYVKATCDVNDESALTGPERFTTLCSPIDNLPYTEEFDIYETGSDAFPSCWERPVTYTSGSVWPSIVSHSTAPSSPNSLKFRSEEDVPTYAVSPSFAEDIQDLRVSFMLKREGTSSGTMDIGVMSDPLDITTFELVQTIEPEDNNYTSYTFNLNTTTLAGGNNHIALRHNSNASNWFYWMDDFTVEPIPSCLEPSDLILADTAETTADISWTLGDSETSWNISWGTPDYTPGDGDEISTASASAESYQVTGLTADTHYDVYVQADCGGGDESIWVGPLAVFTGYCIPTTTGSSAYIDGFSATGDSDQDIENIDTGSSLDENGYSDYTNLPALKVYAASEVDFTVDIGSGTNTAGLRIWVDWDQDLVFGDQDSGEEVYASAGYEGTHTGSFTVPTDAVGTYRFRVGASYTPSGGPADPCVLTSSGEYEDYMIEILALGNCADATAGTLVTQDMSVCAGTSFTLEVEGDSDVADGLTRQWMSSTDGTTWDAIAGATDSSYTATDGVSEETQFKYVVSCAIDNSDNETDSITISLSPGDECYCEPENTSAFNNDYVSLVSSEEAVLNIDYSASSHVVDYIDETAMILEVYAGQEFDLNTAYDGGTQTMGIWVDWNSDGNFGGVDNPDERLALSNGASPQSFDITIPNDIDNGEYRLRVRGAYDYSGNIVSDGDDFSCNTQTHGTTVDFTLKIVDAPACLVPSDLVVSSITLDSADISWTEGSTETEWEVKYGAPDFDPLTEGTIASASINPELTINELDASTTYDVYVRAVCGVDDESAWVGPESFTTLCGSLDMPWSEGFESGTANSNIVPNLACWSQEYVVEQNDWKFVTANGDGTVSPHSGSLMAELRVANFNDPATKLITPAMDLTSLNNAQLTFYFANATWGIDIDQLRVYYKKSASDSSWTLIDGAEYTTSHLEWEEVEIILPEADDATDYLIAFEATSKYARGVNLDDISIGEASALCDAATDVEVSEIAETTATVSWTDSATASEGYVVEVYEEGENTVVFTESVGSSETSVEVTGLLLSTGYDVYVVSDCGSGNTATSDVVNFTTEDPVSCDAVTDVVVSAVDETTATVNWTASATATNGYIVDVYGEDSDPNTDVAVFSATVAVGVTTVDVTDLSPDTDYDVYVTSDCGGGETTISDVVTFTTEPIVGVDDFDLVKLTVYPNPVNTDLIISAAKVIEEVQVYNILGQRVMTHKSNSSEITLDVTELSSATYMLKVSVDGDVNTVRFVKK